MAAKSKKSAKQKPSKKRPAKAKKPAARGAKKSARPAKRGGKVGARRAWAAGDAPVVAFNGVSFTDATNQYISLSVQVTDANNNVWPLNVTTLSVNSCQMSFNAPTYGGLANVTTVLVVATSPTSLYPPLMGIAVWPSSSFYFDSAQATIDGNGNLTVEGFAHAS